MKFSSLCYFLSFVAVYICESQQQEQLNTLFSVEGNVSNSMTNSSSGDWLQFTKILIDNDEFQGFLRNDGSFRLSLPSGSYVIHVINPVFNFEALRVNVSQQGIISAQTINYIQPDETTNVSYPLQLQPSGQMQYFQIKPTFRVIDILKSRMVIMMFLPCIVIIIALKFVDMDDPEVKKELNSLDLKQRVPDFAEHLSNLFGAKPLKRPAAADKRTGENDGTILEEEDKETKKSSALNEDEDVTTHDK